MVIDTIVLYILILVYWTLILIQGHKSVKKQTLLRQLSHNVFNCFEWNFACSGVMNLIFILCCPFDVQGREPYLCDFVKKDINDCLYSDIYRPVSFNLGLMIETTKLYILVSVLINLTSFKVTVV